MSIIWFLMCIAILIVAVYKSVELEWEYRAWQRWAQEEYDRQFKKEETDDSNA